MSLLSDIDEAVVFLKEKGIAGPEVGIVLGTGLGKLVDYIEVEQSIDYSEIPHFPESTVESHKGRLIAGTLKGKKVLAMQGRFHFYEGYSFQQVTFPIRVMKMLGVGKLLLSNASGGINLDKVKKADLLLIDDHINLLPGNPLFGKNYDELGSRFPDMSCPYDTGMNDALKAAAKENGIKLAEGVYVSVAGPNLETRAEYKFLKIIGADVVGMSTVPEVIVANHMSLPCAAISVVTDECDPENLKPVALSEILEVASLAEDKMIKILLSYFEAL